MTKQLSKNVGVEFANDGRDGDADTTLFPETIDSADILHENTTLLESGWDSQTATDHVLDGLVRITGTEVLGAHDAEFVCVGDRAFIVTTANAPANIPLGLSATSLCQCFICRH
jgi:hypothetical protein